MTTVYDVSLEMMRHVTDVLNGTATDGAKHYLKDVNALVQSNEFYDRGTLWLKSGTHARKVMRISGHANQKLTFDPLASVICVQQVETATVVGTITGNGNATVVVTAASLPNSPKTLSVAVLNADTASAVATKIRTALNADTDIKNFFEIGGSGADITLTTKVARANDTTMNMSTANGTCTGLTSAPTSANTMAGVVGPRYAVARGAFPWEQIIANIQTALDETYVVGHDESLVGDGEKTTFTLPSGVNDILGIEFERPGIAGYLPPSTHFDEVLGELVFDYGYAPVKSDIIHIYYRKRHDELTDYDSVISPQINSRWLTLAAAKELLFWGVGMYGSKPDFRIEERLNKVLNMMKGVRPRLGTPNLILKSAGG